MSKICQEMAEPRLIFPWEVVWFHFEPHGTKGDTWVLICTINIQNLSRNGWVMAIFPLGGCVIPLKTTWGKRHPWAFFLCQKDPKSVNKWLGRAFHHLSMRQREILCSFIPKVLKSVKKWLSYCHFLPERSKKIKGNALINISAKSVSRFTFWTLKQLDNII